MPSVNLSPETYERLQAFAREHGRTPDAAAEDALSEYFSDAPLTDEEYQRQWDELLNRVRARVPGDIPVEEIEADVAQAVEEARTARLARGR